MVKKKYFFYLASVILVSIFLKPRISVAIGSPNFSLRWPIPVDLIRRISSTFGESRLDHFHSGVDIPGDGLPVYPLADGRIIYQTKGEPKEGELPFGGGGTVIMDHGNYWSGYMHLQSHSLLKGQELANPHLSDKKQIGISGDSGHSGGAHLHFFIYEHLSERIYNPIPYLPQGVFNDNQPPTFDSFAVKLPEKVAQIEIDKNFTMSQDFPLLATIIDKGENSYDRWGIYFLKIYNQEQESVPVKEVVFDYLLFRDGKWLTSNLLTFEDIYHLNYYVLGDSFRNNKVLRVETGGISGPNTQKIYRLDINTKIQ